ncbi:hypothetical protein Taro_045819 [Colocasia esculenta]|uniref:Uncharacterized protein n=1 Tax=Colocasia esculenta TaxID=4460 RepID=A0A843WS83_COLES|nr:hypothetical protein [Colocasia esculenta]
MKQEGFGSWVKISKNEEEAPRTPSPHEILSSLASSPRPTTFGNELGSAKRVGNCWMHGGTSQLQPSSQ